MTEIHKVFGMYNIREIYGHSQAWNKNELESHFQDARHPDTILPFQCKKCSFSYRLDAVSAIGMNTPIKPNRNTSEDAAAVLQEAAVFSRAKFMQEEKILENNIELHDYVITCVNCSAKNKCKFTKCSATADLYYGDERNPERTGLTLSLPYLISIEILPNTALPSDIYNAATEDPELKKITSLFDEAQAVLEISSRSCCVLLRVALEALVEYILSKKDIDFNNHQSLKAKINALYKHNLAAAADDKQLWEMVKDIGNEGAHIREILEGSSAEKADSATKLFLILAERFIMYEIRIDKINAKHERK